MAGCDLSDVILKQITSLHSNASARDLINENFSKLKKVVDCLSELTTDDLNDLIFPDPPETGVQYVLIWDGNNFVFVPSATNPGTKYIIRPDESITVLDDYQYIIADHIFIFGDLNLEGNAELVIL